MKVVLGCCGSSIEIGSSIVSVSSMVKICNLGALWRCNVRTVHVTTTQLTVYVLYIFLYMLTDNGFLELLFF